jgi:heat shock protein HslJ
VTRRRCLPLLLLATLAAAACTTAPSPVDLEGRTFVSTGVVEGGAPRPLVPSTRITVEFGADGGLGVSAGCNGTHGSYWIEGDVLHADPGASTAMGCDPARHAQDEWLAAFFASGPTIRLAASELILADGSIVIHLLDRDVAEPDRALVGPVWTVETVLDGDVAIGVGGDVVASISFSEDGRVAVASGCNAGGATATVTGDGTLAFSDLALTRRGCDGPRAGMERAVLAVLDADVVTWSIERDALTLRAGEAGLVLRGR